MPRSGNGSRGLLRPARAALACLVSALIWLAAAPSALADTPPSLSTPSPPAAVGATITLTQGVYTEDPTDADVQDTWYDCNTSAPAMPAGDCVAIQSGGLTYQVTAGDQTTFPTNFIVVFESDSLLGSVAPTPTNSIQVQAPSTAPSTPTPTPTPAPPAGSGKPTLSGSPQVGATISASPVTLSNNPSYAYQWMRCSAQCAPIAGAITTAYTVTAADLGDTLVFAETATNAGGQATVESAPSAIVTAPTETTLQVSPANVTAGQPATLIATVTSATGQAPPAGAVTFEQGATPVDGCASVPTNPTGASATVTCQAVFSGSSATLSAVFTPNPGSELTGSSSTAVGFVLGQAATTARMTVPRHVTLGKRITFKVRITPQAGTEGVAPTGTVVFLDGNTAIKGCAPVLAGGIARCTVRYKQLGTHSITATYLGDGNFSSSSTHVHKLAVVVPKPSGSVGSLMTWSFRFFPSYTSVTALAVTEVQPGLTVSLQCSGSGCPAHSYVDVITRADCGKLDTCKNVDLATRFSGHQLGVGATLTVRLTHRGWLGKYYSFVIRGGHQPAITTACLAVGQVKPGAACEPQ